MALACPNYIQIEQGEDVSARAYEPGVPDGFLTCRHKLRPITTEDLTELAGIADPVLGPSAVTQTVTVEGITYKQPFWTPVQTDGLKVGDYDWIIELDGTDDVTPVLTRRHVIRLVVTPRNFELV